ncbi:hypothetical protein [Lysinibacillus sp. BW-2-10]|uniref:hypothetical protein n=1 Tax=Lysinibacillus sp. BW-2-10 TaxID=2590030 RepID=UPI00117DDE1F|nr:hypothetical protein [Lysinibacillus sp. BW-2-10]TSI02523.1 hypothetical protein FJQ64_18170 [Lysinibacillus sp. BW-2-10]
MALVALKNSIQLDGFPINTEISQVVFEDLVKSNSKYINIDHEKNCIILKRSFFKKNKQVVNVTRFYAELQDDDVVMHSSLKNDLIENSAFDDEFIQSNYKNKSIVIILESPHNEEYETNTEKLIPIAPAQGQTGRKIERHIQHLIQQLKLFHVLEENGMYRINIINAIPFQTSLHYIHEKPLNNYYRELRDKVWLKMWSELPTIKQDFLKLMEGLKKDSIVINACPKSLKPFINQELIPFSQRYSLFESNHPSSTEVWTKSLFKLN